MQIDFNDIDYKLFRIIKQFAPFGPLNSSPVFISKEVIDNGNAKKLGADKSHLRVDIKTNSSVISGIGFKMGDLFDKVKDGQQFDICYSIAENEWSGKKSLQVMLIDIK